MDLPLLLPSHNRPLQDPFNRIHPLVVNNQLQLATWKVSENPTLQKEFQSGLQSSSYQDRAKVPTQHTSWGGSGGLAGVLQGRLIPFQVMSSTSSTF